MAVKRYRIDGLHAFIPDDEGGVIFHADHLAELARLKERVVSELRNLHSDSPDRRARGTFDYGVQCALMRVQAIFGEE